MDQLSPGPVACAGIDVDEVSLACELERKLVISREQVPFPRHDAVGCRIARQHGHRIGLGHDRVGEQQHALVIEELVLDLGQAAAKNRTDLCAAREEEAGQDYMTVQVLTCDRLVALIE